MALADLLQQNLPARQDPNAQIQQFEETGREQAFTGRSIFDRAAGGILATSTQANRDAEAAEARDFAARSSANLEGQLERRQRGLGLNLSDRQRKAQGRRLGLTRALTQAGAVTGANRISANLAESANRAGAGLQDALQGLIASGEGQLASAEGARNQRRIREEAEKDAARLGTIGAVGGALLAFSSEKMKDKVEVAPKGMLDKLSKVRVDKWRYKGEDVDHVGPYAEEFNETFGVGKPHPNMISLVDAVGVTMAAMKELNAKVEARGN